MKGLLLASAAVVTFALMPAARADIAISVNDNSMVLENGTVHVVPNAPPDTLSVIDLSANPPALRSEIPVPASVVGPPLSVAITPDERLALATDNQKPDPNNPSKLVPGNTMAVVDLTSNPPRVTATVQTGAAPAGVAINRAGNLALVANRGEGSVSAFRIANGQVTPAGKVELGPAASLVSAVAITPDGRFALVTRYGDNMVEVLRIEDDKVTKTNRQMTTGVRPYGITVTADGKWAAVANIGRGTGDNDTVSLIDLQHEPFRIVETVSVGPSPEGIMASPDNKHIAVVLQNGSNLPANSPFHGPGMVKMLRINSDNGQLSVVSEAKVGTWPQGAAFSPDGHTLLVGNMVERDVQVFRVDDNGKLTDTGTRIKVSGGSAALRTARPH